MMQKNIVTRVFGVIAALAVALAAAPIAGVQATTYHYQPSNTADKATAKPGDVITYTFRMTNDGAGDFSKAISYIHLSPYVELVSGATVATKGTATVKSATMSSINDVFNEWYNWGPLAQGQTLTITYQAKVKADAPNNGLIETVADMYTPELTNHVMCAAHTTVNVPQQQTAKYQPTKTVDKTVAHRGDILNYTLKATNIGNVTLTNFYMLDQLPTSGVTYVSGSTHLIRGSSDVVVTDNWIKDGVNSGNLTPGATVIVKYQVKVNSNAANGLDMENVGNFRADQLPNWMRCAVHTHVVVETTPTPTPTHKPTATPTPTTTPTGQVLGATPTPTPSAPAQLPATGPGIAVVVALFGTTGALIGRKYLLG